MKKKTLYLLPNVLDDELSHESVLPKSVAEVVQGIDGLIAESEKEGRRFLKRFLSHERFAALPIQILNEHTPLNEVRSLLRPILENQCWGLVSDAGLPCIADPGANLVRLAQESGIEVTALPGPSSIIMALQLSGLNGQKFYFHGYLPREIPLLQKKLKELEKIARQDQATQIWIEAPYRSAKMAQTVIETLDPNVLLCIALNVTSSRQKVVTKKISAWRQQPIQIDKDPAVFLFI